MHVKTYLGKSICLSWNSSQRKSVFVLLSKLISSTNIKKIVVCITFAMAIFFITHSANAQSIADQSSTLREGVAVIEQPLGLPATDIRVVVANIIRTALGLLGIIVLVLVLYGGFLWMTAAGNDEQVNKAKKVLVNSVIGLVIILSAYAITTFVLNSLVRGTVGPSGGDSGGLGGVTYQNFAGSGALGTTIKDHYPARNQTNVARNTKIVISFKRPVLANSFIEDTNGNGVFGDCLDRADLNWNSDCDKVRISDDFINIRRSDSNEQIFGAVVTAVSSTENNISGIYTIVIKPLADDSASGGLLGSSSENIKYKVHLGAGMRLNDPAAGNPSIFQVRILGNDYYEWEYTYGTSSDVKPPTVSTVFPASGSIEAKNSIIQIDFSEPVDPSGLQGAFLPDATNPDMYHLNGNTVYLVVRNSVMPVGSFRLTNNFKTLEFTSTQICGQNSCGNSIYCLPVCDKVGAACSVDTYEVLLKSARTITSGSFESFPFSGLADLAGNALDGNRNGTPESAGVGIPVFPAQPDNFSWNFNIKNEIDAAAPYLHEITPGVDEAMVDPDAEWSMVFSKRMRADSMYSISIDEKPAHSVLLWKVPSSRFNPDNTTYVKINHGSFINSSTQYYYPIVPSTVEDVHYNCFYPGKGPRGLGLICDEANPGNCCDVTTNVGQGYCCNGVVSEAMSSTASCVELVQNNSPI